VANGEWQELLLRLDRPRRDSRTGAGASSRTTAARRLRAYRYRRGLGLPEQRLAGQACTCGGVGGSYHDQFGQPVVGLGRFPDLKNLTATAHALNVKLDFYGNSCNCVKEEQQVWKAQGGNPEKDVSALASYKMDGIKVRHHCNV
jgi:hypothetical protein